MEEDKKGEDGAGTPPAEGDKQNENQPQAPLQNPIEAELGKLKGKEKRTRLDKLIFTKQRIEEQLLEEKKALGIEEEKVDDTKPLTLGEYKKIKQEEAKETALDMADDIQDEKERELTKFHLENTIKLSGDPKKDLRQARLLVNAVKTAQIAEEAARKSTPSSHFGGAGAPPLETPEFNPTPEEAQMMQMKGLDGKPLLTKEDIIKSRSKKA